MFYVYKVKWYDSYSDEEKEEEGLVWAENYGAAANNVVEDYGDEVTGVYISSAYSEADTKTISKQEVNYIFENK